jgi:hypothetical protein
MNHVELFSVVDQNFGSGAEFREYLIKNYEPSLVHHELTIAVGLTKYQNHHEFIDALNEFGFKVIKELGKVLHVRFGEQTDEEGTPLESYVTHDAETNLVVFYTNFRKTKSEEIPKINEFLKNDSNSYYLFFKPTLMKAIVDELIDRYEYLEIHEFSAKRDPYSKIGAHIRPDYSRTISYWGDDGKEVLKETEHLYGVLPTKFLVYIPYESKFKVDDRGLFTFSDGKLEIVFEILDKAVEESKHTINAFDTSSFKSVPIETSNKKFLIPSSTPASIYLKNTIEYHELNDIKNRIRKAKYTILDFSSQENSLFLSTDLVTNSGYQFRIKADDSQLNIFPDEKPIFSEFMKFYEFILRYIDSRAELSI